MSKIAVWLALTCGLCAAPFVSTGCSDSCQDLAEVCARCTDASYRTDCEQTVGKGMQDVCSGAYGSYTAACPYVADAGASSSSASSSGASSSSGAGGAGGSSSSSGGGAGGTAGGGAGGAATGGGGTGGAGTGGV